MSPFRPLLCLLLLGAPACAADRVLGPAPAGARFEIQDAPASAGDSTVLTIKAGFGARTGPAPLYIIDGVVHEGTVESLGLESLDIVAIEVLKSMNCGGYLPSSTPSVVMITTRGGSAPRP